MLLSHSVGSDSLQVSGLQRASSPSFMLSLSLLRFTFTESMLLWNHLIFCPAFSFCFQSFPASGSSPMSGQSVGASASASVLPVNIQGRFPLGLTGLIFLPSKGLSRIFSVQFSSVTQSCPTLCDPIDCSMPGFDVHYRLPELAHTHVH